MPMYGSEYVIVHYHNVIVFCTTINTQNNVYVFNLITLLFCLIIILKINTYFFTNQITENVNKTNYLYTLYGCVFYLKFLR